MKKILISCLAIISFCLTSHVFASGDVPTMAKPVSYAIPGWVIGVGAGYGYLDTPSGDMWDPTSTDPWDDTVKYNYNQSHHTGSFVWSVHGGYDFLITPNMLLGFQVGYKDLGRSKYDSQRTEEIPPPSPQTFEYKLNRKIDQQAIDALLTAHYYVWRGLNLIGKAGVAYVRSASEQKYYDNEVENVSKYNAKGTIWRFEPEIVLGLGYTFQNHIDIHLLYDHICGFNRNGDVGDRDEWRDQNQPLPPKPTVYSVNMVMIGISYTL